MLTMFTQIASRIIWGKNYLFIGTHGQSHIQVNIVTNICRISIYTALVKRNHSVTMVLPMVERPN